MNKNNERKYYWIRNKNLADAIRFITKEDYFTMNDRYNINEKIYSFINTYKIQRALTIILNAEKELN